MYLEGQVWAVLWDGLENQGEGFKCYLVGIRKPLRVVEHG